jgi:predicted metalloprotease
MTFNTGGSFKGGRVQRGGGRGVKVGGSVGIGGLLIVGLAYLIGGDQIGGLVSNLVGSGTGTQVISDGSGGGYVEECTAEQANTDRNCRLSATVYALDTFWGAELPKETGVEYTPAGVMSFDGTTQTACGNATSSTGPFYCPSDQTIYVDVSFYDLLTSEFGASGGPLAEEYVVAHEMGHHIENEVGILNRAGTDEGADSDSVRIELMADCLAGMWAGNAATTVNPETGKPFLEPISDDQLRQALDAAAAVGDDPLQQSQAGYVNPESFTHGTSEQRVYWFAVGYDHGTIQVCNTFNYQSLDRPS